MAGPDNGTEILGFNVSFFLRGEEIPAIAGTGTVREMRKRAIQWFYRELFPLVKAEMGKAAMLHHESDVAKPGRKKEE